MDVRDPHDRTDLSGVCRKHNDVRRPWGVPGFTMTVMLNLRWIGRASIAEQRLQVRCESGASRI